MENSFFNINQVAIIIDTMLTYQDKSDNTVFNKIYDMLEKKTSMTWMTNGLKKMKFKSDKIERGNINDAKIFIINFNTCYIASTEIIPYGEPQVDISF